MPDTGRISGSIVLLCLLGAVTAAEIEAPLPAGVVTAWDPDSAYHETTPTREKVCLNGLWRWQPADAAKTEVPTGGWGHFKVPGCWPGISDYMQYDFQTIFVHPEWKDVKLGGITAAWYQREFTVPAGWAGRRITFAADYLNSFATVYVDGKSAGELRFPGGEAEITSLAPAGKHLLSLRVVAMPLKGVMLSYSDTSSAKEVKGSVARRGLCGDTWLVSTPTAARIADVKVDTSVRKSEITVTAALDGLAAEGQYLLRAQILDYVSASPQELPRWTPLREFTSPAFTKSDLKNGHFAFTDQWKPDKLWDIHTPTNMYQLQLTLVDAAKKPLDTAQPQGFGFREFWIDGRDFYLNGTRIYLSAATLDNAAIGAALATYESAVESLLRLKSFGINFVYTHNYGCEPGTHLGFEEILRAADDVGMLVSFSQPHFGQYDWKAADADQNNGYARHAGFYVRAAQNHPAVVFYSMSHNATGYNEDINPDCMDGIKDMRGDNWSRNNTRLALRAEAIVHRLDPSRIVYHHSSGNLTAVYSVNFYPNFVPIQELSDWFEHWSTAGVKPMFTCEYGAPFTWDWTMYRGWYKGERSFGSAKVPWEFCVAEWDAQFLGDRAFQISDMEKADLRFEAKQFRDGKLWYRWDYPFVVGARVFADRHTVTAMYLTDNWRAFRTWGLSANSPWEFDPYWKPRDGLDRKRIELPVDWRKLQRPGFSPDYIDRRYERMDVSFARSDWLPTASAEALIRNNQPLLAYIAGKAAHFTSKDHNVLAGGTLEKQLIVINNSRETVTATCAWSLALPQPLTGTATVTVPTGDQQRVPLHLALPAGLKPGAYELTASVTFSKGEPQQDSFTVNVMAPPTGVKASAKIALFDPKGETAKLLTAMGVNSQTVAADADLSGFEVLIIGKAALTLAGPGPDISRVRDGLKVILFEQTPEVLEKRFGFRIAEYGLRQVFTRVPSHPLLAGIDAANLRDWCGEATILPPRLNYELNPRYNGAPTVKWCGIDVTRLWRCGNRGNVASVLIEKPARGDFLPLVDGGYSLQYSPLLEYREGKGLVLFCQMDVSGRTENDPAAEQLARNIVTYVSAWKPEPRRTALYIGDPAGKSQFEKSGIAVSDYASGKLSADQVLIVGPGGGQKLSADAPVIGEWLKAGGHLLAIGLDESEANAFLPAKVAMKKTEHIAAWFEPPAAPLTGIGPADVHNRDPREIPLVTGGATILGDGVVATAANGNVIFCQLAPWTFDYAKQYNLKRTFRRTSFLVSRLLANLGVSGATPVLDRCRAAVDPAKGEKRWLDGLYLDLPEENDDPYRFFGW